MKTKTIILVLIAFVCCIMLAQDAPRGFRNPADVESMTTHIVSSGNSPSDISGLQLWLKPESLSGSDGDPISTWSDSSGNSYDGTASSTARPLLTNNVLSTYEGAFFDGSNDIMTWANGLTNAMANVSGGTIIMIYKQVGGEALNDAAFHFSNGITNTQARFDLACAAATTLKVSGRRLDADGLQSSSAFTTLTNQFQSVIAISDWANASAYIYTNNVAAMTDNSYCDVGTTENTGSMGVWMGKAGSTGTFEKIAVVEVIIYNKALNASELSIINTYLTTKFGAYSTW